MERRGVGDANYLERMQKGFKIVIVNRDEIEIKLRKGLERGPSIRGQSQLGRRPYDGKLVTHRLTVNLTHYGLVDRSDVKNDEV